MKTIKLSELLLSKNKIKQAYTGLEVGCRCGCHGRYFDPGMKGFTRAVNKAFKLNPDVYVAETMEESNELCMRFADPETVVAHSYESFVDIVIPDDSAIKTITLYF